jgi:hypothetical protein
VYVNAQLLLARLGGRRALLPAAAMLLHHPSGSCSTRRASRCLPADSGVAAAGAPAAAGCGHARYPCLRAGLPNGCDCWLGRRGSDLHRTLGHGPALAALHTTAE